MTTLSETQSIVLNAFELKALPGLTWQVATYRFNPLDGSVLGFEDAKMLKKLGWDLRREHQAQCKGNGFVLALGDDKVIVPATWRIPDQSNYHGFRITRQGESVVRATRRDDWKVVQGILKEAVRARFKDTIKNQSLTQGSELGLLWQDGNDFCTLPEGNTKSAAQYARRISVYPERLAGGRIVLEVAIRTLSFDSQSLASYYARGEVANLAKYVNVKRMNRRKRKTGGDIDVRVLVVDDSEKPSEVKILTLAEPELILTDAELDPAEQKAEAGKSLPCVDWIGTQQQVANDKMYLVWDTHIAGDDHQETILDPFVRREFYLSVRNLLNGMSAFGQAVILAQGLVPVLGEHMVTVPPPKLRIKTSTFEEGVIPEFPITESGLKQRARERSRLVRQNGFLDSPRQHISPLVFVPANYDGQRAKRFVRDLNDLVAKKQYGFKFGGPIQYKHVDEISKALSSPDNALIAVLPEGRNHFQADVDTHDRIKRQVGVTSQCIYHDNTLPEHLSTKSWDALRADHNDVARSTMGRYENLVQNLLIKHGWLPFFPEEGFFYNTHIGIDVGGQFNTHVMACLGYGLSSGRPIILPRKIEVRLEQREPIYAPDLYEGLKGMIDLLCTPFRMRGQKADLERVLFFRDGELRGQGEEWHEDEAFDRLFARCVEEELVSKDAIWTVVELPKRAALWRQYQDLPFTLDNPFFGTATFAFENPNEVLLTTTGSPYVTQGTAQPLRARFRSINGNFERLEVLRDLVWECDLSFTKQDIALSLPWILYVANAGALQLANAYEVTGITV